MSPKLVPAPDPLTTAHALDGDARALHRLCAHYHPQVVGLSRRVAARHGLAEAGHELAQEVWCRLLARGRRRLRDYDPVRGPFRSFLRLLAWQQAHVVAKRWARRQRCEAQLAALGSTSRPTPLPSQTVEDQQLLRLVLDAAAPLDDLDHRLLGEVIVTQHTVHELAPRLARSPAALYKRIHRLRARLRTEARRLDGRPAGRSLGRRHGPARERWLRARPACP